MALLPIEPLRADRVDELRKLATLLRSGVYNLTRAADELDLLAAGRQEREMPPTPWLEAAERGFEVLVPSGNELYPHLPDSSWHLLARFKRQPQE